MARHLTALAALALALALGLTPAAGAPRPRAVTGKVLAVTTREAYIDLGADHGLRPGDQVRIAVRGKQRRYRVVDLRSAGARVEISAGLARPAVGSMVRAWITAIRPSARRRVKRLPPPESAETIARRWEGVSLKREQLVKVPGPARVERAGEGAFLRGSLQAEYSGLYDLGSSPQDHYHRVALLSDLELPRLWGGRLDYAHRVRVLADLSTDLDARPHPDARPHLLVQRLRAGLRIWRLRALLGRFSPSQLPAASVIDGASARVRLSPSVYLGAFGGLSPRVTDLRPAADSGRFGAFASLRFAPRRGDRWQATADLGAVGSTWDGTIDRTALAFRASFSGYRSWVHVGGVLDLRRADASGAQINELGLTQLALEVGTSPLSWLELDLRFDRYQTAVTRELISGLGAAFLEVDPTHSLRGSVELRLPASFSLMGQVGWDTMEAAEVLWFEIGLHRASLLLEGDHLWAAFNASRGSVLADYGGRVGFALPLLESLTLTPGYAIHHFDYSLTDAAELRHIASAALDLSLGRRWWFTLDAAVLLSPDEEVAQIFASAGVRF